MKLAKLTTGILASLALLGSQTAAAKVVRVEMSVVEKQVVVDNAGTKNKMWTYGGTIPGPVVRVTQGDTVDFSLLNEKGNKQSHSMDFHAAIVDVLDEFQGVRPGRKKDFKFEAKYPGVFIYHCGADAMSEHISRGMYGVIIVDPKEGYSDAFPKPDREYVIVEGDLFEDDATPSERTNNDKWKGALINGKQFHYDPVHDQNASMVLESKPGERVRIFFVNAKINESSAFHPIAGIWDKVWDNGNPKNVRYGMQTINVAPAHGVIADLISPEGRSSNNALVDHQMKSALNGAITVLMNKPDADPKKGRNGNLVL
ncbi:multicopper oxidase domain-containing protein [Shewanella salipaludis]|uniref:Copper-containing nitrite reductase n=1 Tax=Shewanella salipaludis TaxID=2723052 RepID=A0A972FWQ2_9GAMM|nr:multicopper oxidase domain-containing protein [Shewanella salipaludis]NMH66649.1 multicopper oxidase domain-containing protein [Shewanella salipaludis]